MIDEILTRECLFCGCILIDMIDNDITVENSKDYEFYNANEDQNNLLGNGEDDDEWDI